MAKNTDLNGAKSAKKDEFYTQLVDIENEVKHYRKHFKGATVLCNCDDPECSNFYFFFRDNFEFLGLKKLTSMSRSAWRPRSRRWRRPCPSRGARGRVVGETTRS